MINFDKWILGLLFLIANEMHMEQGLTVITEPMPIARYLP